MKTCLIRKLKSEVKIIDLLNDIFNIEQIEINRLIKKYFKILIVIIILSITLLFYIENDCYYTNNLVTGEDSILLVVDKEMVNEVQNKSNIFVNDISSNYSINRIIPDGDICYIDVNLGTNIIDNGDMKYKIFLGKEKMIEYFIRTIKKI